MTNMYAECKHILCILKSKSVNCLVFITIKKITLIYVAAALIHLAIHVVLKLLNLHSTALTLSYCFHIYFAGYCIPNYE